MFAVTASSPEEMEQVAEVEHVEVEVKQVKCLRFKEVDVLRYDGEEQLARTSGNLVKSLDNWNRLVVIPTWFERQHEGYFVCLDASSSNCCKVQISSGNYTLPLTAVRTRNSSGELVPLDLDDFCSEPVYFEPAPVTEIAPAKPKFSTKLKKMIPKKFRTRPVWPKPSKSCMKRASISSVSTNASFHCPIAVEL